MRVTPATLNRCLAENDDDCWVDLWLFFERWVASQLRRILKRFGFTIFEAENVSQEIWVRLLEDDRHRLASFQGISRAQLKCWLVRVSVNFTRNWIKRQRIALRCEQEALAGRAVPDRDGPSEQQVESLLHELEPLADEGDVRRLLVLAGFKAHSVSDRSLRQWSRTLREKYGEYF